MRQLCSSNPLSPPKPASPPGASLCISFNSDCPGAAAWGAGRLAPPCLLVLGAINANFPKHTGVEVGTARGHGQPQPPATLSPCRFRYLPETLGGTDEEAAAVSPASWGDIMEQAYGQLKMHRRRLPGVVSRFIFSSARSHFPAILPHGGSKVVLPPPAPWGFWCVEVKQGHLGNMGSSYLKESITLQVTPNPELPAALPEHPWVLAGLPAAAQPLGCSLPALAAWQLHGVWL